MLGDWFLIDSAGRAAWERVEAEDCVHFGTSATDSPAGRAFVLRDSVLVPMAQACRVAPNLVVVPSVAPREAPSRIVGASVV
jgi:hypothetical protein